MSGRIEKSGKRSKSTEKRLALAALIDESGVHVMPYGYCKSHYLRCKMLEGVSRCHKCVRRGRSCDNAGAPVSSLSRIASEQQRLKREEEAAEQKLIEAQQEASAAMARASEALARLARLRRQKASLVTRGAEMVNRELSSLDELEAQEESDAVVGAQASGALDVVDWSTVFEAGPMPFDFGSGFRSPGPLAPGSGTPLER